MLYLCIASIACFVLPIESAPEGVKAYLASAEKLRPKEIEAAKERHSQVQMRRNRRLSAAEKKKLRDELKAVNERIKNLESDDYFAAPVTPPGTMGSLAVGYCGRVQLLWDESPAAKPGSRPVAQATVLQILDAQNCIAKVAGRTIWLKGVSTESLTDGSTLPLNGAWHASSNRTYETVAGGSQTVLVLEPFEELLAIPYLPEPQAKSLSKQLGVGLKPAGKK